jgi:hypothetical protein
MTHPNHSKHQATYIAKRARLGAEVRGIIAPRALHQTIKSAAASLIAHSKIARPNDMITSEPAFPTKSEMQTGSNEWRFQGMTLRSRHQGGQR